MLSSSTEKSLIVKFLSRGPTLSFEGIRAFETRHKIVLPPSYRQAMLKVNGGIPERALYPADGDPRAYLSFVFPVDGKAMRRAIESLDGSVSAGFLPIAASGSGDYFLVQLATGAVYYLDHEGGDEVFDPRDLAYLEPDLDSALERLGGDPVLAEPSEMERIAEEGDAGSLAAFLATNEIDSPNEDGYTLAQLAARAGNLSLLRACMINGASLEGAMALAASGGQRAVINFLLGQGCDINELRRGRTPLTFSAHNGREFRDFMIRLGARDAPV